MNDAQVDSGRFLYAPLNNSKVNPHTTAIPVGAEQHWACAFVSSSRRTMRDVQVDSSQLLYAPLNDSKDNPRATAIPGTEQLLGMGRIPAFLTRHCNRHGTLAFLPFEANLEASRVVQYGQASAPRG